MSHTAGPWNFHPSYHPFPGEINNCGFDYLTITIAKGERRLAEVTWDNSPAGGWPVVGTVHEMRANAILMATAPKMLDALKWVKERMAGLYIARGPEGQQAYEQDLLMMAEVIAEAEGRRVPEPQELTEEVEEEEDCRCVRVDVDIDDARDCPLHGPDSQLARRQRAQEAKDEAEAAARLGHLLGFSDADRKEGGAE